MRAALPRAAFGSAILLALGIAVWLLFPGGGAPEVPAPMIPVTGRQAESRPELPWSRHSLEASKVAQQGVTGLVIDETARPVAGAEVLLLPSGQHEFARAAAQPSAAGGAFKRSTTDVRGRFRVGVEADGPEAACSLWILAPELADLDLGEVRVRAGHFTDVGTIRGKRGAEIEGTVRSADGRPIESARVHVLAKGATPVAWLLPGRAGGLCAETDAKGTYLLRGAPFGSVDLYAVAEGHARGVRCALQVANGTKGHCDFTLVSGSSIDGVVIDTAARPLAAASLAVRCLSAGPELSFTETVGPDGRFRLEVPRGATCEIEVSHPSCERLATGPIPAGAVAQRLVLHRLGAVQISVRGTSGWALNEYTAALRTEVQGSDGYGHVDAPVVEVKVRPGEFGSIEGIVPRRERYVLQVDAREHARGYSEPFTIELDHDPELVMVQLDAGGALEGRVLGANGAPLLGARVVTLPALVPDIPDTVRAVATLPSRITPASALTDAEGRFAMPLLASATYCLRIVHKDHCDTLLGGFRVESGAATHVPDLRMRAGTLVRGIVRRAGVPTALLGVTIQTRTEGEQQSSDYVSLWARSGGDGSFAFGKRLPPGDYVLRAAELAGSERGAPLLGAPKQLPVRLLAHDLERSLEIDVERK